MRSLISSSSRSYAAPMSAHSVSPPTSGTSIACSSEPSDGLSRQVTSLCQTFS